MTDYWLIHEIERECGMEDREVDFGDVTIDELLGAPRKKPVTYKNDSKLTEIE